MARGITQEQVNQAADAIVAIGERPTVEKVRIQLGTGSPNTVTRMLETWRQGLAERLRAANELPSLPDAVGQAMTELWSLATRHALDQLQAGLQSDRACLEQEKTTLARREAEQASTLAAFQANLDRAEDAARLANAKTEALQHLVERLETEIRNHAEEQHRLAAQNEVLRISEAKLRDQLSATEKQAARERDERDQHIRKVEDRAHTQVDRARVDLKTLRAELTEVRGVHRKEQQAMQQQMADLGKALAAAEREGSRQRGIAEALTLRHDRSRPARIRKPASKTSAASKRRANTRRG